VTPEELLRIASANVHAFVEGGKSVVDAADDIAFAANNYHGQRAAELTQNAMRRLMAVAPCAACDSPCEGGECDPPHVCRKHASCAKCNQ